MSLNWVMLGPSPHSFVALPGERTLYTSPPRTTFTLSSAGAGGFTYTSSAGVVVITNQRILYIPTARSASLESFSAPITHLHDSRVAAPFFGPNTWNCVVQPVVGGGIPTTATCAVELKLVFKDGGAFDFHSTFERVKERVHDAREAGVSDVSAAVHLDELPAYEDPGTPPPPIADTLPHPTPLDAPPGYEEVQRECIARAAVGEKS